jgi:hypothetical protein
MYTYIYIYILGDVAMNENNGQVAGIHQSNQLGPGIQGIFFFFFSFVLH